MKVTDVFYSNRFTCHGLIALLMGCGFAAVAQTNHTLVAHYTFDNTLSLGQDTSGNSNNINIFASDGSCGPPTSTTLAKAGSHAAFLNNMSGACASWFIATNSEVLSAIASNFSISLWLDTTDTSGSNTDAGFLGEGIVSAFNGEGGNILVPMTLNGSKLGFFTGGIPNDTLHSASSINTGQYVHLVVTRNQATGVKMIYVNGALDASDTGSTNLLNNPTEMDIGYVSGSGKGIGGEVDDVQVYSTVLSGSQISYMYAHPGSNAPIDFNTALGTTNLTWTTGSTNGWFIESTNTYESASAAQSGVITGSQTSSLQTTVTGPGMLTFWWQTETGASDFEFDLEFEIDGGYKDDIDNIQPWTQDSFPISAGTHTLTWTAYAGNSATDAGYLDVVTYTPTPTGPSSFSLINPQISGGNFQFSFQSQSGFSNTVYYSTNAAGTNWQTYTNLTGDGTVKTIQVPVAGAQGQYFRVLAY
jgi:hypothetical protein